MSAPMPRGRLRASRPGLRTRGQYQTLFFHSRFVLTFSPTLRESIVIIIEIHAEFCQNVPFRTSRAQKLLNVGQYVCCCSCLGSRLALSYWTYYDSHKTCIQSQNKYKKIILKENKKFYFISKVVVLIFL